MYPKTFKDLIRPIRKELALTVLLSVLGTLSLLIAPVAVTVAISKVVADGGSAGFVLWIAAAGIGLALKQLLHVGSVGYAHFVEAKFRYSLRKDFSDKLSRLPLGFFSENSSGAIRKCISEDTIKLHTIIAHAFSEMAAGITLPVSCAVTMFIFEWHTACIILGITFAVLLVGMSWMSAGMKKMGNINARYEAVQRDMSHAAIEMVDGIKEIKNFGIAGSLFKRFDSALREFSTVSFEWLGSSSKALSFIMAAVQPTVMLMMSLGVCLFSIKMAWLPPAYTILFILLSISLPSALIATMQLGNLIQDGKHSVDNLLSIYAKQDQAFKENPTAFVSGDIQFDDVSFSYDGENTVLKHINTVIEKGKLTALVGSSGSGKTTMARLIARFWDAENGRVSIGGVDVKDLGEKEMLSNISLVFQDVSIMNASIADNIALSKPNASREEIIAAAKSALIHERIMKLPNGYDSVYGEESVVLSGGEKQRLTIARSFLADSPIVLLDEATAQADAQSEAEIQKALAALSRNKTVVMIAHRLSSIADADKILVFDKGEIVQTGTHKELVSVEGVYKEMWEAQVN